MYNILMLLLNGIIYTLVDGINLILAILPNSPFKNINNLIDKDLLAYVNWVIPLDLIAVTLTAWLICIGTYYGYSTIMRWVKAIE